MTSLSISENNTALGNLTLHIDQFPAILGSPGRTMVPTFRHRRLYDCNSEDGLTMSRAMWQDLVDQLAKEGITATPTGDNDA